ncbi:hypothetical protein scyTo_0013955 [Scyliorhinus torazame]|uniref:Eukaryotic translation initiation factor 2 subunit 2 n=1 Tax=Scyliorhinus torazame TaxID=75743 RepID=A0A401P883_SCYTO|nr:hypothetical protein [Scyliorhinus torazame]
MIFDPTMTKKKKKKKKPFMLEEDGVEQPTEEMPVAESKEAVISENVEEKIPELDEEDNKKKGLVLQIEGEVTEQGEGDDDAFDMSMMKKKKPKPVTFMDEELNDRTDELPDDDDSKRDDGITFSTQSGPAWAGSERDYTYDELLTRVFNIMREKNPDMVAGEKRKFVMKPPQVVRVGTKKTSFVNFTDICKLLHRQPKHLLAFLLAELGTSGSIDGNNQLVIKGRFQQKQIENVLRRYIKEYVTCHTCRSPDTILQKDTRLYFLQCETCHSRCSVASIKTGFQAVTGKRAQLRAKAH